MFRPHPFPYLSSPKYTVFSLNIFEIGSQVISKSLFLLLDNDIGCSRSELSAKTDFLQNLTSRKKLKPPFQVRERSIFMGIRDGKICNGTTAYFGPSVGRGNLLC